ncbi:MAG: hypothetical protein SFY95_04100 [Planctomycetota bacterium]|nr:hypothetical protein [Planctomycetota bacterium]
MTAFSDVQLRLEGDLGARLSTPDDAQRAARGALGLPTDAPIVMTGHQAELWHAGILAKYVLARELAESRRPAHVALIVADQDTHEPLPLRYPARRAGQLAVGLWPAKSEPLGVPTGSAPARANLSNVPDDAASDDVRAGLELARRSVLASAGEPTLAAQMLRAMRYSLAERAPGVLHESDAALFATRLCASAPFAPLLERLVADPRRCAQAYNDAAARVPEAGMTPLALSPRVELPLWRVQPGRARVRVFADQLATIPRDQLAPRALLMTAFLRAVACDVFIHGTGGGLYDRITDQWIRAWWPELALAPTLVATATLFVPMPHGQAPAPEAIHRAIWQAHHARHAPVGTRDERKRALVGEIARCRDKAQRQALFQSLQALLREHREESASALARADEHARAMRARLEESSIVFDRTWPFPLHTPAALSALRQAVHAKVQRSGAAR